MAPTPQTYPHLHEEVTPTLDGDSVVISGMSGLFPKSHHVKEFSEVLYNKVNAITPNKRWKYNHPEVAQYTGNVPTLDRFDAQFFKVHYRLGCSMDVMGRKILEQTYQAIYDAGMSPEHLNGKKVGVYIGSCFSETEKACFYDASSRTGFGIAGCSKSMFANRVSYWLNAKGPSMAIDQACCSSMEALEKAYLDISRGECEAAIVGGAHVCLHPQTSVHHGRIMSVCADGNMKSFDQKADGCTKTEAINVLFLQKAKHARRIYAEVLKVKCEFIQIPRDETGPRYGFYRDAAIYTKFLNDFYKEAKVSPEAVEYVEAFGSAIPEADKSELEAIEAVFCKNRDDALLVGSVMSNIGYGEAASGISAVTKVLLGYHNGELAANLHYKTPRQDIAALHDGRMRIVTDNQRFRRTYTAVNGMSVTGVNAHVLLNGHYKPKDINRYKSNIPYLVTISGRQDTAVKKILDDLKSRPIDPEEIALFHNIHKTRISGHLGRGYTILDTNEEKETVSLAEAASYFDDSKRPLWFVYSGMGSQWAGMGTQLMRIPVFAAAIERCRKVLEPKGVDIVHIITSPDKKIFDNILHSFVGIAAVQIGLTDVLTSVGIVPDMIIGHSVGELGCAYADGCFTAEEMILSAYSRGLVSVQTPFIRGSMAAVGIGYEKISKLVPPEIEVACHNGPDSSTISGPADAMRDFVTKLTAQNIFAKEVPCSNIAYHSRYIAEAGPGLLKYLREVIKNPKPRSERWVSTSIPQDRWNEPVAKTSSAEYHTNNLLSSVLFEETSRLIPANAVLVEVAPHGLLQAIVKRSLPESCRHIPLTRRAHPDNVVLVLDAIGKLYMEGYNPEIQALYPRVEFPVSTGTPFLSHQVEWAHAEQWSLPLYKSAHRTTAAASNFVLSIHDDDYSYLQGLVIRGKNLYPCSAALVAVWDTLAMTMGVPKKQLSVEFHDVHLYVQPVLHDQRQLKLNVALHKGSGRFEILEDDRKLATGYVTGVQRCNALGYKLPFESKNDMVLKSDDIYQLLHERYYSYDGDFRSIHKANLTLTEAEIIWNNNWVTFLEGIFQLNILRHDHDGVSQVYQIETINIDIDKHALAHIEMDKKTVIKANVFDLQNCTRCGGVLIENIILKDLPSMNEDEVTLKAISFIPRFQFNTDVTSALEIYLQIVSENINQQTIKVLGIVNNKEDVSVFKQIKENMVDLHNVNIEYEQLLMDKIISMRDYLVTEVDLIIVRNLSKDDNLCHMLYRILPCDIFLINEEDISEQRIRPSSLFKVVSSLNTDHSKLELVRWRPTQAAVASTVVTVRTNSDLDLLSATRASLPQEYKLIILSSYPSIPGLKELVKRWRKESNNDEVYVVMISEKDHLDQLPELDLAFNVLENGVWGGEYYTPWQERIRAERGITLRSSRVGDLRSLHWEETPQLTGQGIPVSVYYAAINDIDGKRATGVVSSKNSNETSYGMDFSGITDSGVRVMGMVPNGAVSGRLEAQPQLLWPVPEHWSLEDASTVPSAYVHAFYCLAVRVTFQRGLTVLVHGGTGALGQAVISIALGNRCKVFATVSDIRKKRFLLQLFPDLRDDHIGNSRDRSFGDMVMNATKQNGCDVVICCVKEELKTVSLNCTGRNGVMLDVAQIKNQERYSLGMFHLTSERSYIKVDLSSIFNDQDIMKYVQGLMLEGISRGYVRPLSRITYTPDDVVRAFRLLAVSRHRGRVVLRLQGSVPTTKPRLSCSPESCHLLICNEGTFGLQLANRLTQRGARKLLLHFNDVPSQLHFKMKSWEERGIEVQISSEDLSNIKGVITLLNSSNRLGPLEGIYVDATSTTGMSVDTLTTAVACLDKASRTLCPSIKYFAVVSAGTIIGQHTCHLRAKDGLPATIVNLCMLKNKDLLQTSNNNQERLSLHSGIDAMERSLCTSQHVVLAHLRKEQHAPLLQQIADIAEIDISKDTEDNVTLLNMGIDVAKVPAICSFLSNKHNVCVAENNVPLLTVQQIQRLEKTIYGAEFSKVRGLGTFFSYVDPDELLATTETIFMSTMVKRATMGDEELDVNDTYLCIVPGMEGHYERFRVMCDQLKLAAMVLQPGLDHLNETHRDTADRYVKAILKKAELKENFYLLGYESGVLIALEMAALLEDHGFTGTVYCIGGTPEEFQATLEEQLRDYKTEEDLQTAVAQHMFSLMTGTVEGLDKALQRTSSWQEKTETCVRMLLGSVPHSAHYARGLIDSAYTRIRQARVHKLQPRKLKSQLILLHAKSLNSDPLSNISPEKLLQRHSSKPVIVHELRAPLAHATQDLRCAAIVNRYLDTEMLKAFEQKNLCETYLIQGETMTVHQLSSNDETI